MLHRIVEESTYYDWICGRETLEGLMASVLDWQLIILPGVHQDRKSVSTVRTGLPTSWRHGRVKTSCCVSRTSLLTLLSLISIAGGV